MTERAVFKPSISNEMADAAVAWSKDLAKELGLYFQPAKTIRPMIFLEFLGLELDSSAMEVHLP